LWDISGCSNGILGAEAAVPFAGLPLMRDRMLSWVLRLARAIGPSSHGIACGAFALRRQCFPQKAADPRQRVVWRP
jgi:hypothetical protein